MMSFHDVIMTVHVTYDVIIFELDQSEVRFEKKSINEILDSDWS